MPSPAIRPQRQTDYRGFSSAIPIVIDNGGFNFRIGWAGESVPRITFRNLVHRPRHKGTGEIVTVVGDHDPLLLKYFDCTRSSYRSPFDSNVVYQFELMEYVLDYGFERLGAEGSQVDHPILMTECVCNPISSRSKMAELLFETYGVPSIAFGVDAAFGYKFNQQHGICGEDGLAVCSGFSTSHVIPFVEGEPVLDACCRTNVGGYHITNYLKQLLSLNYPYHIASITWEKVEELKMEHCYVAHDYAAELQLFQKGTKEAEEKTRCWQLPWIPPSQDDVPSEEEIARKAALKEKQGQRLRDIAAAKKSSRISELEHDLHVLEDLLQQLDEVEEEEEMFSFLSATVYSSRQEIESAAHRVAQSLRRARGEPCEIDEKGDASLLEKYPLVNIADSMLTPEQLKEKKKQIFLKTTSEGRLRAKQKKFEEEMMREKQNQQDEEKRLENPDLYLEQTRSKYRELCERVEQRKRLKTNGSRTNGNGSSSGGVGRGERLNSAQKERMRLLTTAAFDRGKGEDTFGARDEDWQLYKLMSRDNDDDDDSLDEDEAELARVSSRLQEIDPLFVVKSDMASLQIPLDLPRLRPLTAEDFKITLGVERFRCPEILFQPGMVGVDQAGLDEMTGVSLRRLAGPDDGVKNRMCNSILVLGGSSLFPGLDTRLEAGVRKIRPYLSPIRVARALDPVFDAWRGAASYAACMGFSSQMFSIQDYYEKGESGLKQHQIKYTL